MKLLSVAEKDELCRDLRGFPVASWPTPSMGADALDAAYAEIERIEAAGKRGFRLADEEIASLKRRIAQLESEPDEAMAFDAALSFLDRLCFMEVASLNDLQKLRRLFERYSALRAARKPAETGAKQ